MATSAESNCALTKLEAISKTRLIASRDGADGSVTVHQDASLYSSILETGRRISHAPGPGRHLWLQLTRGAATVLGEPLAQGDGAAISGEETVGIRAAQQSELLLFDLG